jgi:hypothetical protein
MAGRRLRPVRLAALAPPKRRLPCMMPVMGCGILSAGVWMGMVWMGKVTSESDGSRNPINALDAYNFDWISNRLTQISTPPSKAPGGPAEGDCK